MKKLNLLKSVNLDNTFEIDISELRTVSIQKFGQLSLSVPLEGVSHVVNLTKVDLCGSNFKILNSGGNAHEFELGEHYRGEVEGIEDSFVSITFTSDDIFGHIVTDDFIFDIHKVNDKTFKSLNKTQNGGIQYNCGWELKEGESQMRHSSNEFNTKKNPGLKSLNGYVLDIATKLVLIDWVADYDIFLNKGANTAAYLLSLFNATKTLYDRDGIFVLPGTIYFWSTGYATYRTQPVVVPTNSPFSLDYLLRNFRYTFAIGTYPPTTTAADFNGDILHLLTGSFPYTFTFQDTVKVSGLADGIGALCNPLDTSGNFSTWSPVCHSQINLFDDINNQFYSETVQVVTHEQGHLMGSPHTHGCYWNTTNFVPGGQPLGCTRIDTCRTEPGQWLGCPSNPTFIYSADYLVPNNACFSNPGIPQNSGGTIMSYCAFDGDQLFSNGFGPQPQQALVNFINSSICLQSLDITPTPTPTLTSTPTKTVTKTPTQSIGVSPNPTQTVTPTKTKTATPTQSVGSSPNPTTTPTITPTNTITRTNTRTKTPTPTRTPTVTPSNNDECSNCTDQYPCITQTPTPTATQQCNTTVSSPVTYPVFDIPLTKFNNTSYTNIGTRFYVNGFQFGGSGSTYTFLNTTDVWKSTDSTNGPLNRSGIWSLNTFPANIWLGFSVCITVTDFPNFYYVGFGADNAFRLTVDGIETINTTIGGYNNSTLTFSNWHVYQIALYPGDHVLNIYGLNLTQNSSAVFGCEIYLNTITELLNATSPNDLNIIFSTASYSESAADIIQTTTGLMLNSGYTCPSGYVFQSCQTNCVRFVPCPNPTLTPTPTVTKTNTLTPGLSPNTTPTQTSTPTSTPFVLCTSKFIPPYTLNGINITYSFTGDVNVFNDVGIICGLFDSSSPSGLLCGYAPNPNPTNFTLTFSFSQSVNDVTVLIGKTGCLNNETFIITTNNGVPTITSDNNCYTTIVGNQINSGAGSPCTVNGGGGGSFTITTTNPYTSLTISGPGGNGGSMIWICGFDDPAITPTPTPTSTKILDPGLCTARFIPPFVSQGVTVTMITSGDVTNPSLDTTSQRICGTISRINPYTNQVLPQIAVGRNGNVFKQPIPASAFIVTFNFSIPINEVSIVIMGTGTSDFGGGNEIFVVTTDTGIPIIITDTSCYTTITNNVISSGIGAPFPGGGGIFTIYNPTDYTSLTISGSGGYDGSAISICGFYVPGTTRTPTPTQTKTPTRTPVTPTNTPTITATPTVTKTKTQTATKFTPTPTRTQTPTKNSGPSVTPTSTPTPTATKIPIAGCSNIVFPNPQLTLNGVTITVNRTGNTFVYAQPVAQSNSCGFNFNIQYPTILLGNGLNGVGITGPPSFFSNWTLSLDFSQSITSIRIVLREGGCTCQYSPNDPENFWFTTNNGIPTITPIISCNSVINNNEIILSSSNPSWLGGETGNGVYTITNCNGFTNLTMTGAGGYLGTFFGICDTSIVTGPCVSQTPTPTKTMTVTPTKTRTTVVQDCSVFYLNNTQLFYYNVDTNVSINVGSVANEIGNPNNIAHTENRLFIWGVNPQQTLWQIAVYSITFQPFSKTFIGYVTPFDGFYSTGLFAIDNNNILIGSYGEQTPSKLQKWDITDLNNPIITDIITLPAGFTLATDILLNQCGKVQFGAVGDGGRYILQYDYNNPTPQPEVTLYMGPNVNCSILPSGLFAKDDKLYFVNYADSGCPFSSPDEIWEIDTFPPYPFVKLYTLPPTVSDVNGASSLYSCSNACLITFTGTPTPTPTQTITNTPTITKTKTQTPTPTKFSNLCANRFIAPTTHNGVNVTFSSTGDVLVILNPIEFFPLCGQLSYGGIPAYNCGTSFNQPNPANHFTLTFNFDSSVNNVAVVLAGTGYGGNENFVFTTNTGIPTISSTFNCYSTISGNQIISGLGAPCCAPTGPAGGGGVFIVSNTNPYTSFTISGDGGYGGTFINICDFDVIPSLITPTPTQTKTSTQTNTPTKTSTNTPTKTQTPTPSRSIGATPPSTQTQTPTNTPTQTKTSTQTPTNTPTTTPTKTSTQTVTPTVTATKTVTPTPSRSIGATPPSTQTQTPTNTNTPTKTTTQTQTQTTTPTKTTTQTPTNTNTPTKTPTQTPTKTPTTTTTPTKTQTSTQTPTPTTTLPKTPTPTPTKTKTPTLTPTSTKLFDCVPFLKVKNIVGTNNMQVTFGTALQTTFTVNWGDGNIQNYTFGSATSSTTVHTYPANLYTASYYDLKLNGVCNQNALTRVDLFQISDIVEESEFANLPSVKAFYIRESEIQSFNSTLPSLLEIFSINGNDGQSGPFILNPSTPFNSLSQLNTFALLYTNIETLDLDFSTNTKLSSISIGGNNLLPQTTITLPNTPPAFSNIIISLNNILTAITFTNGLLQYTDLRKLDLSSNALPSFNEPIPDNLNELYLFDNSIRNLDTVNLNLNGNTELTILHIYNNTPLTSFTNTISACTVLIEFLAQLCSLTSLPPILPNSIQKFYVNNNKLTGFTSNFPTGCIEFRASSNAQNNQNVIQTWNVPVSGSPNLTSFLIVYNNLTGWTQQFLNTTTSFTVDFRGNLMKTFNMTLVSGATIVKLGQTSNPETGASVNPQVGQLSLTGLTNFVNPTYKTKELHIQGCGFTLQSNILSATGNLPSQLQVFNVGGNGLTSWNRSFVSVGSSLKVVNFEQNALDQTSVDFILCNLASNNTVPNGVLRLNGGTNALPSAPGNACRTTLIDRGWDVVT